MGQLELGKAAELNLDDLDEACAFIAEHGTLTGRALANRLGIKGTGSGKLASALSAYAWNRATYARCCARGYMETAQRYEDICDRIYREELQGKGNQEEEPMNKKENPYSASDAGCYVDSHAGIYATDEIVGIARDHGAEIAHPEACKRKHAETWSGSEFAGCEFFGEYEDDADAFMNENFSVDGYYWGRNECGDWGLWLEEDA